MDGWFLGRWGSTNNRLTTFGISPSLSGMPRSNLIFHFCWFSLSSWWASWYQIMYDGGSSAPLTTQCKATVLPTFTYRSGSPINSVLGTAKHIKWSDSKLIFILFAKFRSSIFMGKQIRRHYALIWLVIKYDVVRDFNYMILWEFFFSICLIGRRQIFMAIEKALESFAILSENNKFWISESFKLLTFKLRFHKVENCQDKYLKLF